MIFSIADHITPKIDMEGVAYTLESRDYKMPQAVALENHPQDSRGRICEDGIVQTLNGKMGTGGGNTPMVMENNENEKLNMVVRRLTPLECERLQGFPTIRTVRYTEMTKDEYIAWNINEGNINVDVDMGRVFRTRGPGGIRLKEPIEMNGTNLNGYLVVSIRNGKTKMQCRIHRIVWIAANGIIPNGFVIDHINNDKQDNRLSNLQLLTAEDNSHKAKNDGLYLRHEESASAVLSNEVHDEIQLIYKNSDLTMRKLAEVYGISKSRVHQIVHDQPWTDIGEWTDSKGKKHKDADSPRYKALGNSIALPFWEWMAKRMVQHIKDHKPTMASLFDGIAGFPLAFLKVGCKPIWTSEIEEFPIAVCKKHFGDEDAGIKGDIETKEDITHEM